MYLEQWLPELWFDPAAHVARVNWIWVERIAYRLLPALAARRESTLERSNGVQPPTQARSGLDQTRCDPLPCTQLLQSNAQILQLPDRCGSAPGRNSDQIQFRKMHASLDPVGCPVIREHGLRLAAHHRGP